MILAGMEMPPGSILMEDPPAHDVHRSLMSRVFTPKAMLAIEPKVREFCRRTLDPLMAEGRFDFITDLGAIMPMLTIGMLLGIPEEDQVAIRDRIDAEPAHRRRRRGGAVGGRDLRGHRACSATTSTTARSTRPTIS